MLPMFARPRAAQVCPFDVTGSLVALVWGTGRTEARTDAGGLAQRIDEDHLPSPGPDAKSARSRVRRERNSQMLQIRYHLVHQMSSDQSHRFVNILLPDRLKRLGLAFLPMIKRSFQHLGRLHPASVILPSDRGKPVVFHHHIEDHSTR